MALKALSYVSEKRLNCLAKKNVLHGLKNKDLCSHGMVGQKTRVSFKKHHCQRNVKYPSDDCGPLS